MAVQPALKLTAYFNESLRCGDELAADRLLGMCDAGGVRASVLMRGIEGFGANHRMHTERLERASLNQPVVAVAVDTADRVEALADAADRALPSGLVTLERAWLVSGLDPAQPLPPVAHAAVKLTVYCGRSERVGRSLLVHAVVAHLQRCGVAGATALVGVDGTVHGERRRAGFFSRNRDVPAMVIAVGDEPAISRALEGIERLAPGAPVTLEGVQICKRGGELIEPPAPTANGEQVMWRKLTVHAGGARRVEGDALHYQLVEQLRRSGGAGATSLRGSWGYRDAAPPRGDSVWSVRRTSPVLTVAIDRETADAAWRTVDRLTAEAGLVTSELVPAHRALGPAG